MVDKVYRHRLHISSGGSAACGGRPVAEADKTTGNPRN